MPVSINEILINVSPEPASTEGNASNPPAEGASADQLSALLELMREREERLRCD